MALDLIIAGGRVIDAAASLDAILDVGVTGGKIVAIAPKIDRKGAKEIYDASGQIVCLLMRQPDCFTCILIAPLNSYLTPISHPILTKRCALAWSICTRMYIDMPPRYFSCASVCAQIHAQKTVALIPVRH